MVSTDVSGHEELPTDPAEPACCEVKPPPEKAPASPPGPPPRDAVLDNTKFFLTMCVVGTHTLGLFAGRRWFSTWFHGAMYVFMMPSYVFISGYCSSPDLSRTRRVDGIIKVAAIYFVAQLFWLLVVFYARPVLDTTFFGKVIWNATDAYVGKQRWMAEDWLVSYWHLWYLLDLVFWRLMLPFWWRLRWPVVTAWIFCALFVPFKVNSLYGGRGCSGDSSLFFFDTDGVLGWFPLFCLGAAAKERRWQLWESCWSRLAGLAVLLLFAWIPEASRAPEDNPVFGRNPRIWHYEGNMDALNEVTGDGFGGRCLKALIRLAVPLVHALCVWGCLHVMPRREWRVITSCGSRSLANYIFHPLSGLLFSYLGLYGPNRAGWDLGPAPPWAELAIAPLIVLTSLFWMSPWVWKLLWPMLDPPLHWILRPAAAR